MRGGGRYAVIISSVSVPEGVVPTLNVLDTSRLESLFKAVREAPVPWLIMTFAALAVLFIRRRPAALAATVASGASWAVAGLAFFLVTAEPRSLMVVQVGVVVGAFVTFAEVFGSHRARLRASDPPSNTRVVGYRLLIISSVSLFFALVVSGTRCVLDERSVVSAGERRRAGIARPPQDRVDARDLVMASRGRHTMPVGWWTQGYAQRRTFSGHDTSYLAFPDEREQAELANMFFSGVLTDRAALTLLETVGADFVAVDRRGPDARWLNSELAQTFAVVDDSSNFVILEVPEGSAPP